MRELLEYLGSILTGPINNQGELEHLLAACWDKFHGSEEEGMAGDKLCGRMEEVYWNPPILSFVIERHGGTVGDSSRAELHTWKLDMDKGTASCEKGRYRQVRPMQKKLDVGPIAEAIVKLILARGQDKRLHWKKDGRVRVLISEILPEYLTVKRTLADRRRRFRIFLDKLLRNAGWQEVSQYIYAPPNWKRKK